MARERKFKVSRSEYQKFIEGLSIEDIFFKAASFECLVPKDSLKERLVTLRLRERVTKEEVAQPNRLFLSHSYSLSVFKEETNDRLFRFKATIVVEYKHEIPLSDEIFEAFRHVNLPLNTWPYFREYVQSSMARLNLPPIVLPALKRH